MTYDIHFLSKHVPSQSGTVQMRCHQPVEYLTQNGWKAKTSTVYRALPSATKVAVFHRVVDDPMTQRAMRIARAAGCTILYDIDDFLFSDSGIRHLSKVVGAPRKDSAQSYRNAMMRADHVICSTEFLKEHISEFHPSCIVMRNGLSKNIVELAMRSGPKPQHAASEVTLAYFAGSVHHSEDFAILQPALIEILRTYPNTRFLLVGPVSFDPAFKQFSSRFEHRSFVPYPDFIRMLSEADINLVPLDQSTPISHARSELKFIEAGVFAVPSIASPTRTFSEVIKDGENGVISNDADWYPKLARLVEDQPLRQRLGKAAQQQSLQSYSPEKRGEEWNDLMLRMDRERHPGEFHGSAMKLKAQHAIAIQWRAAQRRAKSLKKRFLSAHP